MKVAILVIGLLCGWYAGSNGGFQRGVHTVIELMKPETAVVQRAYRDV